MNEFCSDCDHYDGDETDGKCKVDAVKRVMKRHSDGTQDEVINGWPVVLACEPKCGKFKIKTPKKV